MILQEGKKKNSYIIEGLFLPLQTEKRLEALGMTKGTPVEVLNRKRSGTISGTMIVRVRGTRFALGRGITGKIEVAEDKKQ
ncbi:MAG: FeoA family protein [Clostridium sp.]